MKFFLKENNTGPAIELRSKKKLFQDFIIHTVFTAEDFDPAVKRPGIFQEKRKILGVFTHEVIRVVGQFNS